MDQINTHRHSGKANDQLLLIDLKKHEIKKEIYRLYDIYLKKIRTNIRSALIKGINTFYDITLEDIRIKEKEMSLFINRNLDDLISHILPFLTIEQLTISDNLIDKKLLKNNDDISSYLEEDKYIISDYHKEFSDLQSDIKIYECYPKMIDFYTNNSINLDNGNLSDVSKSFSFKYQGNYQELSKNSVTYEVNQKISSTLQSNIDTEDNLFIPKKLKKIIDWADYLDISLNSYLRKLSIEINNQFCDRKMMSQLLNRELIEYFFENNLFVTNPYPFITLYDLSLNQFININKYSKDINSSKIYLFHIDATELEFYNLNLGLIKSKISDLKKSLYLLIKKEKYWSNKINSTNNNIALINKI